MLDPLGPQRIEQLRREISSDEPAAMSEVVHTRHQQAEHEERRGIPDRLAPHQAAPAAAAVVHESSQQAEHRRRGPHREAGSAQERQGRHRHVGHRAQQETADARDRVDDHHPRRAVDVRGRRPELPDPHHVEQDVQGSRVQPRRAHDGPPAAVAEHRHRTARPEQEQGPRVRREQREQPVHANRRAGGDERQRVEPRRAPHDERDKPQVVAEPPEQRRESPQPGIPPAAVETALVVDADQVSTGGADDGTDPLAKWHMGLSRRTDSVTS